MNVTEWQGTLYGKISPPITLEKSSESASQVHQNLIYRLASLGCRMDLISNKYLSNLATRRCIFMRDVKKILEMRSQNFSQRQIAETLKVSRDTVRKVYKAADEK